jgi:hypothetical protein
MIRLLDTLQAHWRTTVGRLNSDGTNIPITCGPSSKSVYLWERLRLEVLGLIMNLQDLYIAAARCPRLSTRVSWSILKIFGRKDTIYAVGGIHCISWRSGRRLSSPTTIKHGPDLLTYENGTRSGNGLNYPNTRHMMELDFYTGALTNGAGDSGLCLR